MVASLNGPQLQIRTVHIFYPCSRAMRRGIAPNIAKQFYFLAGSKSLPVLGLMR